MDWIHFADALYANEVPSGKVRPIVVMPMEQLREMKIQAKKQEELGAHFLPYDEFVDANHTVICLQILMLHNLYSF